MEEELLNGGAVETSKEPIVQWKWQYKELKKRFLSLQQKTLALSKAYEEAADEWQLQRECQQVLVEKYAQIRVRRMQAFRNEPMDGRMLFMEESKHTVRKMHPLATRKDIREYLTKEWTNLPTPEQELWNEKLKVFQAQQFKHPSTPAKGRRRAAVASGASANKTTPSKRKSATKVSPSTAVQVPAAVKRRKTNRSTPTATSARKSALKPAQTSPSRPKKPRGSASTARTVRKDKKSSIKTPRAKASSKKSATPTGTPDEFSQPSSASSSTAPASASASNPASISSILSTPTKSSPSKARGRPKKQTGSPGSNASPARSRATSAKRKKTPLKAARKLKVEKLLASDAVALSGGGTIRLALTSEEDDDDLDDDLDDDDDDDEDDDEDDDDNGASGSDEDSDEQLAHLPTGAFG